jgi:hypothetical protein
MSAAMESSLQIDKITLLVIYFTLVIEAHFFRVKVSLEHASAIIKRSFST